jgi:hypothetical protein
MLAAAAPATLTIDHATTHPSTANLFPQGLRTVSQPGRGRLAQRWRSYVKMD